MSGSTVVAKRTRAGRIAALLLACLAIPFVVLGMIDPLEGGIALLLGLGLCTAARALSSVRVPRLAWIAFVASVAIGLLLLVLVIAGAPDVEQPSQTAQAVSPAGPAVRILLWCYRIGVLVTLVGVGLYVVRIAGSLRSGSPQSAG